MNKEIVKHDTNTTELHKYMKAPKDVIEEVSTIVKQTSEAYQVIEIIRHSTHPDDNYLYKMVIYDENSECYIVWTYNHSTKAVNCGHYQLSYKTAMLMLWDFYEP